MSSIYGENYLFWKNGTIRISLKILTGHTLLANDLTICFKKFQKVDPVIVSTDHNDLIVCHVSKIFLEKILKKIDSRFTKNIKYWVQICFKCLMRPFSKNMTYTNILSAFYESNTFWPKGALLKNPVLLVFSHQTELLSPKVWDLYFKEGYSIYDSFQFSRLFQNRYFSKDF